MSEGHWLEEVVARGEPSLFRSFMLGGSETAKLERDERHQAMRSLDASLTGFAEAIMREVSCEMPVAVSLMLDEPSEAAGKIGCEVADVGSWCERVLAGDTWWRS